MSSPPVATPFSPVGGSHFAAPLQILPPFALSPGGEVPSTFPLPGKMPHILQDQVGILPSQGRPSEGTPPPRRIKASCGAPSTPSQGALTAAVCSMGHTRWAHARPRPSPAPTQNKHCKLLERRNSCVSTSARCSIVLYTSTHEKNLPVDDFQEANSTF